MNRPETGWRKLLDHRPLHADLVIRYSDLHPYHGGSAFELFADGTLKRYSMERGGEVERETAEVAEQRVEEVAELAAELELWRQQTPEREPNPDESRAEAQLTAGGETAEVWEWFNDLEANDRLIRLADRLRAL